uniref:Uncharacterized protein n=1 Tax=Rhipicephalus zambeziensis TaxID=60191 RepID=A0A224Y9A8_9ACAR
MTKLSICRVIAVTAALALLLSMMPAGTLCEDPEALRGLVMLLASKIKPVTHIKPAVIKTKVIPAVKKPGAMEVISSMSDVALELYDFFG